MLSFSVESVLNAKGFEAGLRGMKKSMANFGTSMFSQYLSANALSGIFRDVIGQFKADMATAKETKLGAKLLGVDYQTFQTWKNVMESTGGTIGTVEMALKKIAVAQESVRRKQDQWGEDGKVSFTELAGAANALGLTLDDFQKSSRQKVFQNIMDQLGRGEVSARKMAALIKIMGRGADQLIPAAAKGLDDPRSQMKAMTDDQIESFSKLKEDMGNLSLIGTLALRQGVNFLSVATKTGMGLAILRNWLDAKPNQDVKNAQTSLMDVRNAIKLDKERFEIQETMGKHLDKDMAEKVADITYKSAMKTLSAQERIFLLNRENKGILEDIADIQVDYTNEQEKAADKDRRERYLKNMQAIMEARGEDKEGKMPLEHGGLTEHQRAGAFFHATDPVLDVSRRSEGHLAAMRAMMAARGGLIVNSKYE